MVRQPSSLVSTAYQSCNYLGIFGEITGKGLHRVSQVGQEHAFSNMVIMMSPSNVLMCLNLLSVTVTKA